MLLAPSLKLHPLISPGLALSQVASTALGKAAQRHSPLPLHYPVISKDCGFLFCSCCVHYAIWLHFGHSGLYPMFVCSQNLAMVSDIICLQLIFIYLRDELKATNSTVLYGKKEELTYKYNKHNFTHLFSLMHCKFRSNDFSSIVITVYLIYINEPE